MIHRILEEQITSILGSGKKGSIRVPESFAKTYPDATFHVITPKTVDEFLL